MKKILFIIPSLEIGGTLSSFVSLYNAMKDKCDIAVFAISHDGLTHLPFEQDLLPKNNFVHAYRCNYSSCKGKNKFYVLFVKLLKKILTKLNIDDSFVYKHCISAFYSHYDVVVGFQEELPNKLVSMIQGAKKYAWIHCDYSRYFNCGNEFAIYKEFNKIICVSSYTSDVFKSFYPALANKTSFIYNILDTEQILKKSEIDFHDPLYSNDSFTILSVGRIAEVKRFDYIPKIASQMKSCGAKFKWYIIGPNIGDLSYTNLMQEIDNCQVSDCVIYLGGKSNPYPYFKKSNLLVSLSKSEACPMIFNEAKILGVPAVSTNFPSAKEFIEDGYTGKICELSEMSDVLIHLINDKDCYKSLLNNVLQRKYSNSNIVSELESLFEL